MTPAADPHAGLPGDKSQPLVMTAVVRSDDRDVELDFEMGRAGGVTAISVRACPIGWNAILGPLCTALTMLLRHEDAATLRPKFPAASFANGVLGQVIRLERMPPAARKAHATGNARPAQ